MIRALTLSLLLTGFYLGSAAQERKADSLKSLLNKENSDATRVALLNELGEAYATLNFDTAVYYLNLGKDIASKLGVDSLLAQSYGSLGRVSLLIGNSQMGMEYLFESLKLYERTGNERKRIAVLNNIALIFYRNNDLDRALAEFLKIEKLAEANKQSFGNFYYTLMGSVYNNIGIIYDNRRQSEKALETFMKGLNMSSRVHDETNMATLYVNMAKGYQSTKQFSLAETNFEESLRIRRALNDKYGICRSLGHLGALYLEREEFDKAQQFLEESLAMARELGSLDSESHTAKLLVDVYHFQGHDNLALEMLTLHKNLDDSLRNDGLTRKLLQVEMQYEFEKKQREAQAKEDRRGLIFVIVAGVSLSVAIIAVLSFFLQRTRANNERLQKDNLQLANGHLMLEKKALEENLEFKNKELTTNVMYLMKKNEMLIDISERLMEVKRHVKKEDQTSIQRIILELNTAKDNDVWEEFEVRFNQVYNDFYERLMDRFPHLSPNDRKLCAFLRLNMSSKEICAITRQNPNSLNVARTRLRKKLGIENPEINLVNFLEQV